MRLFRMLREHLHISAKTVIYGEMLVLSLLCLCIFLFKTDSGQAVMSQASRLAGYMNPLENTDGVSQDKAKPEKKDYIKWVEFGVTSEAMNQAFRFDVDTCQADIHLNWVDLLAYLGTRYGGDFSKYKPEHMTAVAEKLKNGETTMEEMTRDMKYYNYYRQAYGAVLDGLVGQFEAEIPSSEAPAAYLPSGVAGGGPGDPATVWVTKYGLKAFSPIAKGFPYSDFDDFGVARSYGFKRQHLGHDMMGQVGTPVIAVESGYVEAIGWNQYGGWRLGIRSFDQKRYYYYAHLRKNYPFQSGLKAGSVVQAGDVVGYLGRTGYSRTENTNNIDEPHLHFGLELIFDESQKDSNNEIWVSCYELVKFLNLNRCETVKVEGTKEWTRVHGTKDPSVPVQPATPSQARQNGHGSDPGDGLGSGSGDGLSPDPGGGLSSGSGGGLSSGSGGPEQDSGQLPQ